MNGVRLKDALGRISRTGAALCGRTICLAGGTMLLVCAGPAAVAQAPTDWRLPPGREQLLPDSLDCWEPALAVGPRRQVFVAGRSWSTPQVVSAALRPRSGDRADHDFPMIAASGAGRVCVVWVDDRRGALDVWTRCSSDAGETWGPDVLFSDRNDGAPYKSTAGFKTFYGHYGGVASDASGRLHAAWGEGEPEYRTGAVWFNSIDLADALRR